MSSIEFNFQDGTQICIPGMYRFWFQKLCGDLFFKSLDLSEYDTKDNEWLYYCFDKSHYIYNSKLQDLSSRQFEIALNCLLGNIFLYHNEKKYDVFHMQLNTAMQIGSDPVKLATRIHAQCEIFCYIEEKNINWIADIIDQGIFIGIFDVHANYNHWKMLSESLRKNDKGAVVISYSVTDSFPNILTSNMRDKYLLAVQADKESMQDEYYDIPAEERFLMGLNYLRSNDLELKPENWNSMYFGDENINGFKFKKLVQSVS